MNNPPELKGAVTTYIDMAGNLIIYNPDPDIDWDRLEELPEDAALAELLEYQTANGFEWIQPEEIGALTDAPIIAWGAVRDDSGKLIDPGAVYWFESYQVTDAIKNLKGGRGLVFLRGGE